MIHTRYELTPSAISSFPLFIESIGHNEDQEKIFRPHGFSYFHWLQTYEGEGEFIIEDKTYRLTKGTGVLLYPDVAHTYYTVTDQWCTQYITFGGSNVDTILHTLGIEQSTYFSWEEHSPLHMTIANIIDKLENNNNDIYYSSYDLSSDVYFFLMQLKQHGQMNNRTSIQRHIVQLQPVLDWLEIHYADPNVGIEQMATVLKLTPRQMNTLFQTAFHVSPYAYLIRLRLRKSKEMLLLEREISITQIASRVGFRDVSHFVASFRKQMELTPEKFRLMN